MSQTFTEVRAVYNGADDNKHDTVTEKESDKATMSPISDSGFSNVTGPIHIERVERSPAKDSAFEDANSNQKLLWSRIRRDMRDPFAEFFGVFILILFGDGSVAQVTLAKGAKGEYQSITWGWALGVMLGVHVAGVSGAHLNPAITFCNCVYRKFPWRKFPSYMLAQTLGAFCAAAVVYGNYKSAIDQFEGGKMRTVPPALNATAGIFCTYPAEFLSTTGQFFSEFIASTILMFVIFALNDPNNLPGGITTPLALFMLIFGIGGCWGFQTGYAINFARDFGPRLFTYMVGYGTEVWSAGNYYFWVPMVSPFFGCLFGGWLYDVFLYTGNDSPVNTPWMGLKRIIRPEFYYQPKRTSPA
ncbi:aquaglyceroporin [Phlyctema vagabunda]|uniref:Aquaglyceroporin n=1 Tax=Phlyctema vagabunda TaxID=108571 RepID=A0ABR4PJL6_9HELO